MTRKFLYELVDEILKSDNREEAFKHLYNTNRFFAEFVDVTYNKNYHWEFDSKYNKKPKNLRKNGGDATVWMEVIRLIKRQLINNTKETPNFMNRLDRLLDNCNTRDIKLLLCMLRNRSIQYINTKKVYEWYPEFEEFKENE